MAIASTYSEVRAASAKPNVYEFLYWARSRWTSVPGKPATEVNPSSSKRTLAQSLKSFCRSPILFCGKSNLVNLYRVATREFLIDSRAGGLKLTSQHDGTP